MSPVRFPTLYQINTRAWMTDLTRALGRHATLDDVPDDVIDSFADRGFDWIWLLGVWQTGPIGRAVSMSRDEWLREYRETLSDLTDDDICGSCFAITGYTVSDRLGGDTALARLRKRLANRGIRLMLDFVPNHTAIDHHWVTEHPEYYVDGSESDLQSEPQNWTKVATPTGPRILAYGRDPFFPGWPDTLQLNYGEPTLQAAMRDTLVSIAKRCDGVRCDMAMLELPDVFSRTWGIPAAPFWKEAIAHTRAAHPEFLFVAEVYWDLEWTLQQEGFDFTYDKRLYDRIRERNPVSVRAHLAGDVAFQNHLVRFLENHDEPRAAAVFPSVIQQAAAVISSFAPGLRFFHNGQLEGRRKRLSVHLCRRPEESLDPEIRAFYDRLLAILKLDVAKNGEWHLLDCRPAWDGNWTWDCFIAYAWRNDAGDCLVPVVNFRAHQGQCRLPLPFEDLHGKTVRLDDLIGAATYDRGGDELTGAGLYLDLPGWGCHVFKVTVVDNS